MKNIKWYYHVVALVFLILSIFISINAYINNDEYGSLILSGVALIASCYSMGLSDKEKLRIKGNLSIYGAQLDGPERKRITIKFKSNSEDIITDLTYRIKLPYRLLAFSTLDEGTHQAIQAETCYLTNSSYKFLDKDEELPINLILDLSSWKKGNIVFYFSGSNFMSAKYILKPEQSASLLQSSSSKILQFEID